MDITGAFAEAMRNAGLTTDDEIVADGKLHRVTLRSDKKLSKNGWYVLHDDGIPAGSFGSWKSGQTVTWCAKSDNELTADERAEYKRRIAEQRKQREADEARAHAEAAERAATIWAAAVPANDNHPYLSRKQIPAGCAREYKNMLVIPARTADGKISSLQFITPDGEKRFLTDGQKRGAYATVGRPADTILIAEGYATAATLNAATGHAAVIAFDAGNLAPVAQVIRDKFPDREIIICADNDRWTIEPIENPGLHYARLAAKPIGARVAYPLFDDDDLQNRPTDWNDYALLYGNNRLNEAIFPRSGNEIQTIEHANDNALTEIVVDFHSPLPDMSASNKPLATIENVSEMIRRLGAVVRYNVITKEEEILIPHHAFSIDNRANASVSWIMSWAARFKMPTEKIPDFITYLADQNLYNPVANWIESKPWDGISRLANLCATIHSTNDPLKDILIRRWMLSAIAAAFEPEGVSAHGVLVLQGSQYLGKTKWFKTLVPAHLGVIQDGLMLRPDDRDSVKQCVSNWLVELGEIDSTFRKSDIAQLKSFITKKNDVIRRAYARKESNYARRTVFFGSVNPKHYLHDATGNRRFWTIECTHIDHSHSLDMQQVWAEVYSMYQAGETYYLEPHEMDALNTNNEEFTVLDPIQERIQTQLDWSAGEGSWTYRTATDVLISVGIERPTQSDVTKAAQFIRDLNGNQCKRTNTSRLVNVPPKKVHY